MINNIHVIELQSVGNMRDLGGFQAGNGKHIKYGKIIRSAHLHHLSETDQIALQALGVNKVIDFRGLEEQQNEPDKPMPDTEYFLFPVFSSTRIPVINEEFIKDMLHNKNSLIDLLFRQKEQMQEVYRDFVFEESALKACHDFFQILLESDKPKDTVLFHCTAGKDRTGFAAALFLRCMGVNMDCIINDYLITNGYLKKRIEETIVKFQSLHIDDTFIQETKKYFLAQEDYLKLSFQTISDNYRDFQIYLKMIGIDENAITKLFDIYTG